MVACELGDVYPRRVNGPGGITSFFKNHVSDLGICKSRGCHVELKFDRTCQICAAEAVGVPRRLPVSDEYLKGAVDPIDLIRRSTARFITSLTPRAIRDAPINL